MITTPDHDDITQYLRAWSKIIIDEAKSKNIFTIQLDSSNATRAEFNAGIGRYNPEFILFNGHGNSNTVKGYKAKDRDAEILLQVDDNDSSMKGRIIFARTCESLGNLGKTCVQKGAKAYVGHRIPFFLPHSGTMASRPLEDEMAKPFIEVSNSVALAILKGATVGEAIERSKARAQKWIEYYNTHYTMYAEHILPFLKINVASQAIEGDSMAKLY